jgi:hypothetical protein
MREPTRVTTQHVASSGAQFAHAKHATRCLSSSIGMVLQ